MKKKRKAKKRKSVARRTNADPRVKVMIGENVEKVFYRGGRGKPKESRWVHVVESHARLYGMPDGSIKIESADPNIRLWEWVDVEGKL